MAAVTLAEEDELPAVFCGPGQKLYETVPKALLVSYMDRYSPRLRNYQNPGKNFVPNSYRCREMFYRLFPMFGRSVRGDSDIFRQFERLLDRFQSPVMCYSLEFWCPEHIAILLNCHISHRIDAKNLMDFTNNSCILVSPDNGILALCHCSTPDGFPRFLDGLKSFLELWLRSVGPHPGCLPIRAFLFDNYHEKSSSIYEWSMSFENHDKWIRGKIMIDNFPGTKEHDRDFASKIERLLEHTQNIPPSLYEELVLRLGLVTFSSGLRLRISDPRDFFPAVEIRQIRETENETPTYGCLIPSPTGGIKPRVIFTPEQVRSTDGSRPTFESCVFVGAAGTGKTTAMQRLLFIRRRLWSSPVVVCASRRNLPVYQEFIHRQKLVNCELHSWPDDDIFTELLFLCRRLRYSLLPGGGHNYAESILYAAASSSKSEPESYSRKLTGDWGKAFKWFERHRCVFIDDALVEHQNEEQLIVSFTAILALLSASKLLWRDCVIAFDGTTKYCQQRLQNFGDKPIFQHLQELFTSNKFDFRLIILPHVLRCPRNTFERVHYSKLFSDLAVTPSTLADNGPAPVEIHKFSTSLSGALDTVWEAIVQQVNILQEDGFRIHEIAILASSNKASKEKTNHFLLQKSENEWPVETTPEPSQPSRKPQNRSISQRMRSLFAPNRKVTADTPSEEVQNTYKPPDKPYLIFEDRETQSLEWPAVIHASISPPSLEPCEQDYLDFLKYRFGSRAMIKLVSIIVHYNPIKETRTEELSKLDFLGRGATGDVYSFIHKPSNAALAVKIIQTTGGVMPKEARQEADLLRDITHPNIISFLGVIEGIPERQIWLIMDLANGGSLRDYCTGKKREELTDKQRVKLGADCWLGLSYLHETARIAHGDLKPENVLLRITWSDHVVAKICDFGTARITEHLTTTEEVNNIKGTVMYIPPECVDMNRNAALLDVYSIGATLVELFTGYFFWHLADMLRPPANRAQVLMQLTRINLSISGGFPGVDTENQAMRCAATMLNKDADHCSSEIADILKRTTSFDRRKRPEAAEAFKVFTAAIQSSSNVQ